ncbi:hypothetical protein [Cytobacillus purgationiresistens]|uniref:Apea-like HEPN domain-containing protein n=1 Tax=Cytobacillus purgationiresistens TaxID=863449 RepID=A0ABU0AF90_9BACI|nr:hypothetical protein [Cytobacillus purgationiresistens]MDQ0269918.1 hypothetical protein [Cytobacillus purgationiresistens]
MKFIYPCKECVTTENYSMNSIDMNDTGDYTFECNYGHTSNLTIYDEKFSILYDMGALALFDGYYREAVSSFAASLERFYEFFIKVLIDKNDVPFAEYEKTWKLVSKQSERQIGAFYFLYVTEFTKAPPKIPNQEVEFRNKVIHKGYIPSKKEAYSYAKFIFEYIKELMLLLVDHQKNILNVVFQKNSGKGKNFVENEFISYLLPVNLSKSQLSKRKFDESIDEFKYNKGLYEK